MDCFIAKLGDVERITLNEPINDPEGWGGTPVLACSVKTRRGTFLISTDKVGRVGAGYINMNAGEGVVFAVDDRIVTSDPVLIASLNRALRGRLFLPAGTVIEPLSPEEAEREYAECAIPRETEYGREGSGWEKF